jgi:hypothetical protein
MRWFAAFLTSMLSFLALGPVAPAAAAPADVDLELVLAVDVSLSMDPDEQRLQRDGYVAAFTHPDLLTAIGSGVRGRIAVTYLEWAGSDFHLVVVPWTVIASREDAESFAARIAAAPFTQQSGTSISSGLLFAAARLNASGFVADRRAVDVSGDGPNNMGYPVDATRDWLVRQGVTINGLPIMLKTNYSYEPFTIPNLDMYYQDCVIGGPGAFMVAVDDPARFEVAIRRKLVFEISGLPPRLMRASVTSYGPRIDCQVGEKARRNWLRQDR